jgi:hypothetical protein
MIVAGHVGGLPLEELLPTLAGGGGSLLLARAWLMLRFRQTRRSRTQT